MDSTNAPGPGQTVTWWRQPETLTAALVVFIALTGAVLSAVADANANDREYVTSMGFKIWVGTATLSVGLWLVLLVNGIVELRRLAGDKPLRTLRGGLLCYLILAGVTVVGLRSGQAPGEEDGPIRHFGAVSATLLLAGTVTAAPWVLAVWQAHHRVRALAADIRAVATTARQETAAPVRAVVHALQDVWRTIERCTIALVLLVTTAVFTSGALRNALTAKVIPAEDFPTSAVLGYGALFAAILAAAVLPLVAAWRSRAAALVDAALPLPHDRLPDEEWAANRGRLEKVLHLDVPVLRNPLVGLTVLAPLLTALIAAYLPGTPG
jgi:hypothetical protein